jgi:peptidyl-prolyl cis-trans isomerase C
MRDWFQKPLGQIALLCLLVFLALFLVFGPREPSDSDHIIIVDESDVAQLIAGWQRTWNRMPTREELQGILQSHVKDEVLYQEALNQGLDRNSAVVKRALITQMDMMAEGQGSQRDIGEADIQAYYNLRKEQFVRPAQLSFKQVYFDGEEDPGTLEMLRKRWNENDVDYETARESGKTTMLSPVITGMPADLVDREFGEGFAARVEGLEPGQWSSPVPSVFGWHLIYTDTLIPSGTRSLEEVRPEILQQLQYEDKEAAREQFYTELLQQYEITYRGIAKELVNE